jgi:probable HAF family extracellular repeat protein
MSDVRHQASMGQHDFEAPRRSPATHSYDLTGSQARRSGIAVRLITALSAAMALGTLACTSNETPTDPALDTGTNLVAVKSYTLIDLGVLPSSGLFSFSHAYDINDAGQIVGESSAGPGELGHAFLWHKGVMTDLGTLGGNLSAAFGINPGGAIVGVSFILRDNPANASHAFRWKDGVMTDLGTLGGRESVALDINPAGQVVGTSQPAEGITSPIVFLWDKGVMTSLGFEAFLSGVGINSAGRVVGDGKLWDKGVIVDLGTLGGCCTFASAINAAGQVVGRSYLPGSEVYHAFLWEKGRMTDLGTLEGGNSQANGINARGQVVGQDGNHAFVWEKGVMTELPSFERALVSGATAINGAGQIVGSSDTFSGARATLWTGK